jgi:hypothetical protein
VGLAREADIFIQGYRPRAVAAHGFGPEEMARLRPGIVYASLSAYGHEGPWARRRGFDSLVQTASGLNLAEAEAFGSSEPRALPAQALDHATGYLLAFAIMAALKRRAEQGGSWHVRASLAQTGHWLRQLGRIDGMHCRDPGFDDVRDRLRETQSGFGRLTAVHHAAEMSERRRIGRAQASRSERMRRLGAVETCARACALAAAFMLRHIRRE